MTTTTGIHRIVGNYSATGVGGNVKTAHGESVWLNSNATLPPVDCPLLIERGNTLVPAVRTGFIPNKSASMEYRLGNGDLVCGRFRWTYP